MEKEKPYWEGKNYGYVTGKYQELAEVMKKVREINQG